MTRTRPYSRRVGPLQPPPLPHRTLFAARVSSQPATAMAITHPDCHLQVARPSGRSDLRRRFSRYLSCAFLLSNAQDCYQIAPQQITGTGCALCGSRVTTNGRV